MAEKILPRTSRRQSSIIGPIWARHNSTWMCPISPFCAVGKKLWSPGVGDFGIQVFSGSGLVLVMIDCWRCSAKGWLVWGQNVIFDMTSSSCLRSSWAYSYVRWKFRCKIKSIEVWSLTVRFLILVRGDREPIPVAKICWCHGTRREPVVSYWAPLVNLLVCLLEVAGRG